MDALVASEADRLHPSTVPAADAAVRDRTRALRRRIFAAIIAVSAASVLGLAAYLDPSPTGVGTHSQMGLPSCGWIITMDMPCPTCGMTTSFAHAANGNLLQAFLTQPMGAALAVVTAMALLLCTYITATGSRIAELLMPLARPRTGWIFFGLIVVAWGYKIVSHRGWI